MSVLSPCNAVCQMDITFKLCKGCWRTIDEIIDWSKQSDDAKRMVWALIEERKLEASQLKTP